MATITLTYNLDTKCWTSPSGTTGTSYIPSLTFGEKPTLSITLDGNLPQGVSSAVSWSCAIAKDWLKSTIPMARTTENITVSDNIWTLPIDTATERFLAVVDGVGQGVACWLQITGYDTTHTPCVEITLPILCHPALDPAGAGTIPPIKTSDLTSEQIQAMINASIASAVGLSCTPYTALSGTSGTVEPGKIYTLTLEDDFTLTSASTNNYGEAVIFVTPNGHSITMPRTEWPTMSNGMRYRILISWTPFGALAESTGEWVNA